MSRNYENFKLCVITVFKSTTIEFWLINYANSSLQTSGKNCSTGWVHNVSHFSKQFPGKMTQIAQPTLYFDVLTSLPFRKDNGQILIIFKFRHTSTDHEKVGIRNYSIFR